MSAAHGGFGSENVPLGGGAAVFERLVTSPAFQEHSLLLLGAGPDIEQSLPGQAPPSSTEYLRVLTQSTAPSALSMMEYARFSQDFGKATTETLLRLRPDVVVCHDISEGPDIEVLARAGIPVVTIFHVDVVDIFSRLYLGGLFCPAHLARNYRATRHWPWPCVLRLVFEKQQNVADYGALSVVPSTGAHELLEHCYPESQAPVVTLGWGAPEARFPEEDIRKKARMLRTLHKIPDHHRVLLTLSRLSPEKAQHRLLEALLIGEKEQSTPSDITVVIAGAPAFMEGQRHAQKLYKLADKLKTRVIFTGHVGGLEKAGWYELATLFVVNSLHESYGLTTLEAMQRGCPVVAVRSFGTTDTVTEDVGLLVPPGPELARRLLATTNLMLAKHFESHFAKMAKRARVKAGQETFDKAASTLASLVEDVANL